MYTAYYLERSDGEGGLCTVLNTTDISEKLSNKLQSEIEKVIKEEGKRVHKVTSEDCEFPPVWVFPKWNMK